MINILIADDHPVVRKGLHQILTEAFPGARIEEAEDGQILLEETRKGGWNVVITDLSMPGMSGLDLLQQLKQYDSKVPVLVLSIHPEEQYAIRVLRAGAAGYMGKEVASDELVGAVQRVLGGKKYISAFLADRLAGQLAGSLGLTQAPLPHELLSDREFDVLKLLVTGKSINQIAALMTLGPTTISTYRSRILAKMGMKTNADLIHYALVHKLTLSL